MLCRPASTVLVDLPSLCLFAPRASRPHFPLYPKRKRKSAPLPFSFLRRSSRPVLLLPPQHDSPYRAVHEREVRRESVGREATVENSGIKCEGVTTWLLLTP